MNTLESLLPTATGLILVLVGVFSHDPTVRDVGIGFLGGGVSTGAIQKVKVSG